MCSYILFDTSLDVVTGNVLEVGAGVGLPSLLLGEMKKIANISDHIGDIFVTDVDARVLENLHESIRRQFEKVHEAIDCGISIPFSIQVSELDWDHFSREGAAVSLECDVIIGAALCYSTCHVSLADTFKYVH